MDTGTTDIDMENVWKTGISLDNLAGIITHGHDVYINILDAIDKEFQEKQAVNLTTNKRRI